MLTSMKGKINSNTIIVVDFITLFTPMDRSTKQKVSKETQPLNDKMDQLDLYLQGISPKNNRIHLFSNCIQNIVLGHKSSLGKLKKKKKKTEIISSIFSNHSAGRLDVNYKKKKKNY